MDERSLYDILGVDRDADESDIRRAYRRLTRRHHPDLNPDDADAPDRYRLVCRAFLVLSQPSRRAVYDAGRTPVVPPDELRSHLESPFEAVDSGRVTDVVAELFGLGPAADADVEERDVTTEVTTTFAEAIRGVTVDVSLQRERTCSECGGVGAHDDGGRCDRCSGRGAVVALDRLRVRLPAGVEDGSRLRVAEHGHVHADGAGDLYLLVRVTPHPYFRRRGLDIHAELPVTLAEATLGAEVDVPTIDGTVGIRLPAATESGKRFRLRGRGLRAPTSGERGDHYATVRIVPPAEVDDETRAALERIRQPNPRRDLPTEV